MAAFVRNFKPALACLIAGLLAGFLASATSASPARIVSTSLCADTYVLALADPDTITALSWQANSKMSAAPASLRRKNKGLASAERLVSLMPDLIVMGPGDAVRAAKPAQAAGAALVALPWVEDLEGVYDNLRMLGVALGQESRAETKIAAMQAELMAIPAQEGLTRPRILYLTPNGTSAGAGVFVDAAIKAAGGVNHSTALGIQGWGRIPLEELMLNPPDLVIQSFFDNGYPSVANLRHRHPLMVRALKDVPVITIPGGDWVCAGPRLLNATRAIAEALQPLLAATLSPPVLTGTASR